MKKIFICALLLIPFIAFSQVRLEDKSHKTRPDWINGTEKSFLIISETAPDIETAKQKILMNLKAQIAETVATKIISESTLSTRQSSDGENMDFQQDFQNYVNTKTANIPFINEISLSKAIDYYWEKFYNKKTKTYFYEYHIKYLLMEIDIRKMVDEFKAHEQGLNQSISDYENGLDDIKTVETIDRNISSLRSFRSEFEKDDVRLEKIDQLINDYRKMYKNIVIEEVENSIGSVGVRLKLNKKVITTSQIPKITSNCANQFNPKQLDDVLDIDYNFFDCYEDDANWIDIRYKFGSEYASHKVYIKLK